MPDPTLDHLEALARAATAGPWKIDPASDDETIAIHAPKGNKHICIFQHDAEAGYPEAHAEANARFITAANPQTILALIAQLREEVEKREAAEQHAATLARQLEEARERERQLLAMAERWTTLVGETGDSILAAALVKLLEILDAKESDDEA